MDTRQCESQTVFYDYVDSSYIGIGGAHCFCGSDLSNEDERTRSDLAGEEAVLL